MRQKVIKIWELLVCTLSACAIFYLLTIIPNNLYTNGLVFSNIYMPYNLIIDYAKDFQVYDVKENSGFYFLSKYNSSVGKHTLLYDNKGIAIDSILVDDVIQYKFNYNQIFFNVTGQNGGTMWLAAQKSPIVINGKRWNKLHCIRVSEKEVLECTRLVWINLAEQYRGWKKIDRINRLLIIPIAWIISIALTIYLLVKLHQNQNIEQKRKKQFVLSAIFVLGFPLIMVIIRLLIRILWRLGLWIYTVI